MITKKTKYAIKALIALAGSKDNKPMLIAEIANQENLPKRFLESILLDLKRAKVLNSKMGAGGGYFLMQNSDEIKVLEIIRILDGPIALYPCVSINFYQRCEECKDELTCSIRKMMQKVRDASIDILGNTSIADLLKKEVEMENENNE
ncbi:Rrf2 family transcriptional regulator [Pedobacter psychrophilus]|uniref:Rrf2 family transcriptional regulator n=1 Tax=Pedobacter psychrophilus TaxID=1826909 RepID=A0A179DJH1_9SPHI|nr:Rrf2 family transcriptional regulator [Pedobacter psychrophilus]OAQ40830.1 Rrf2 family transcriptional regulator [Pedobacter psychrophilus]